MSHMFFIPDPNDFDEEESTPQGDVTQTGKEGSGGLSTEDAEEAYQKARDEHFRDDVINGDQTKQKEVPDKHGSLPQIGSIEDESSKDLPVDE